MMYCPDCGLFVPKEARRCPRCDREMPADRFPDQHARCGLAEGARP